MTIRAAFGVLLVICAVFAAVCFVKVLVAADLTLLEKFVGLLVFGFVCTFGLCGGIDELIKALFPAVIFMRKTRFDITDAVVSSAGESQHVCLRYSMPRLGWLKRFFPTQHLFVHLDLPGLHGFRKGDRVKVTLEKILDEPWG